MIRAQAIAQGPSPLIQATRTLDWERAGGTLISVFIVVAGIELLSGWVRKQLL